MKPFQVFCLLIFILQTGYAEKIISGGDVSGVWSKIESPFLIEGDVTIPSDSLLIIEPGVQVVFAGHYALFVQGRLLAVGNEADTISFTVSDTSGYHDPDTTLGGWNGMRFIDTPATNDSSQLSYCKFEFGKAVGNVWYINTGGAVCVINFSKLHISHSLFRYNTAGGLMEFPSGGAIHLAWSDIQLSDNIFNSNFAKAGGGAIHMHESSPQFRNNTFQNNTAMNGAAIQIDGISAPVFLQDHLFNNQATSHGGGLVLNELTKVTCTDLIISGNKATEGGGGIATFGGTLQAINCTFDRNRTDIWGGGMAVNSTTLLLDHCTFSNDTSGWGSGALHTDHTTGIVKNCTFRENTAEFGGGSHCLFSDLSFTQCSFEGNTANDGAGLHIENSSMLIDSCVFKKNSTQNANTALHFFADTLIWESMYDLIIAHTVFQENISADVVAGVYIEQTDTVNSLINVQVDQCEFIDNQADWATGLRLSGKCADFLVSGCKFSGNIATEHNAAAHFVKNCTGRVENCLFSSNLGGACLTINLYAAVDIFNCTFAGNSQAVIAGLSLRRGVKVFLTNSIFWGNSARQINLATAAGSGCELSVNHCCIQDGPDSIQVSDSLSVLNWGTGNIELDPLFADTAAADFHLQAGSPCIGSGINCILIQDAWHCAPTQDLEGNPRPSPQGSTSDMGVYEHSLASPTQIGLSETGKSLKFQLRQNYPNPFNPVTTICYQIPVTCQVDLSIYNCIGQKIKTLISTHQTAGNHRVVWHTDEIAGGLYFYQLQAGPFKQVKKMLILK